MARCLSLAHVAWGLALLLMAAWIVVSVIGLAPNMSSPIGWRERVLIWLLTGSYSLPFVAVGCGLLLVGSRLWAGRHSARAALILIHSIFLVLGVLAIIVGVLTLIAAEASAAKGGGLMGGLGVVPLGLGVVTVALAVPTLLFAKCVLPKASTTA